jgi:hypothetical protein
MNRAGGSAENRRGPWWALGALALACVAALALIRVAGTGRRLLGGSGTTTVTQATVVQKVQTVAKLVATELTVRDIVVYRNRWLGSTKQSLVVVTGKVLGGIDLDRGTEVRVDEQAKHIVIVLPPASVLGVEITDLKTYDERGGLWNPFRPADRDTLYQLARAQLASSGLSAQITEHAEESARRLLEAMVSAPGYTVEVSFKDRGKGGDTW